MYVVELGRFLQLKAVRARLKNQSRHVIALYRSIPTGGAYVCGYLMRCLDENDYCSHFNATQM